MCNSVRSGRKRRSPWMLRPSRTLKLISFRLRKLITLTGPTGTDSWLILTANQRVCVCSSLSVQVAIYTPSAEPTGMCRIPLSVLLPTGWQHQTLDSPPPPNNIQIKFTSVLMMKTFCHIWIISIKWAIPPLPLEYVVAKYCRSGYNQPSTDSWNIERTQN